MMTYRTYGITGNTTKTDFFAIDQRISVKSETRLDPLCLNAEHRNIDLFQNHYQQLKEKS